MRFSPFAAACCLLLLAGCQKDRPILHDARISDYHVSDCLLYTTKDATKDITTDSIETNYHDGTLMVLHHMMADCGTNDHLTTTLQTHGDTITITEHQGEQGMTNCVCHYVDTIRVEDVPPSIITLVVNVEYVWFGIPHTTTVYSGTVNCRN